MDSKSSSSHPRQTSHLRSSHRGYNVDITSWDDISKRKFIFHAFIVLQTANKSAHGLK